MYLRRHVVNEELKSLVDVLRRDSMKIIQHEHKGRQLVRDVIDECRQEQIHRLWLWGLEVYQRGFPNTGFNCLQRGNEVRPEAKWVAVRFIQRDPRDRAATVRDPVTEQRCFAEARWSRKQGELLL